MKRWGLIKAGLSALLCMSGGMAHSQKENSEVGGRPNGGVWAARGMLLEACSCAVPCPCNFRQAPTAGHCHTIYAYRLDNAQYNGVVLNGLVVGGGEAEKGAIGFLDERATAAQRSALEKIALAIFAQGGASAGPRRFVWTRITAKEDSRTFRAEFQGAGGFAANVLVGGDGKNPIVVENNVTWPVKRFIKGQTTRFNYKDALGNRIALDGVNANLGAFQLGGKIEEAVAFAPRPVATGACPACAPKGKNPTK